MNSAGPTILADHGIYLRDPNQPGNYRLPCPRCPTPGPRDTALSVTVYKDGHGAWQCFRCGWSGACAGEQAVRVRMLRRGLDRGAIARLARELPGELAPVRTTISDEGLKLWVQGRFIERDTPAHRYLTARAIEPKVVGGLSHALRWLPDHRHPCGWVSPALVALVTNAETGEPMTLHQTWLTRDGTAKAPIRKPRMFLGGRTKKGGVVRLTPDDDVHTALGIAEGVENALSAITLAGLPCWSGLDAGNLAKLPVHPTAESLVAFADHDTHGRGQRAAAELAERWAAAGREAHVWCHPRPGCDLNDWLRERAGR